MNVHGSVHFDVAPPDVPLFCRQADGTVSVRIATGAVDVWMNGTPGELRQFAADLVYAVRPSNPEMASEPSGALVAAS